MRKAAETWAMEAIGSHRHVKQLGLDTFWRLCNYCFKADDILWGFAQRAKALSKKANGPTADWRELAVKLLLQDCGRGYAQHVWLLHGLNQFDFTRDLTDRLLLTDVPDRVGISPMPFPSFWVKSDSTRAGIGEGIVTTIPAAADGECDDSVRSALGVAYGVDASAPIVYTRAVFQTIDGRSCGVPVFENLHSWWVHEGEGAALENNEMLVDSNADDFDVREMEASKYTRFVHLCKTGVLWLNSSSDDRQKRPLSKKQKKRKRPMPTRWYVGKTLVHDNALTAELNRASTAGWRLRYQHIVRGHFRNQVCGKNRSCRRRIWIQPYWKGPAVEEAFRRTYEAR